MNRIIACIMAGGIGSRFWPASREEKPKQFLDILGLNRSLIQLTYDRYISMGLSPGDIYIVTNERYIDLVREHLPEVPVSQIIGETARRNTAPAAYLGNKLIEARVGDAVVVMAPSDHHIEDEAAFHRTVRLGADLLTNQHDALVTIGINPDFPHTGYGYINYAEEGSAPYSVNSFTEKPDLETAKKFLAQGGYLWNGGIFMWTTSGLNKLFKEHSPEIKTIIDEHLIIENGQINYHSLKKAFDLVPDASIDYEIAERANSVYTIPAQMQWSDLGSWKSLYDKSEKNAENNVIISGPSMVHASNGNMVFAPGKRVVLKGLQDYMVIEDDNTLVICPLNDDQEIKKWRNHFESEN